MIASGLLQNPDVDGDYLLFLSPPKAQIHLHDICFSAYPASPALPYPKVRAHMRT